MKKNGFAMFLVALLSSVFNFLKIFTLLGLRVVSLKENNTISEKIFKNDI